MLTKRQLNALGGSYGSVESYYLDQFLTALDKTADHRDELQEKYIKLVKKYERLRKKLKTVQNTNYQLGYKAGVEAGSKADGVQL